MKKVPNESKLVYAINNFIVPSWRLLFSYVSHLNTNTYQNEIFPVPLTLVSMVITIFTINAFSLKTKIVFILIFYCILLFYICFSSL